MAADGLVDALLVLRPTASAAADPLPPIDEVRIGYLDELAAEQDSASFTGQPPTATELAALFHTGGTTGTPKLAAHTHAGEVANAWMIAANSLIDEDGHHWLRRTHCGAVLIRPDGTVLRGARTLSALYAALSRPRREQVWSLPAAYFRR